MNLIDLIDRYILGHKLTRKQRAILKGNCFLQSEIKMMDKSKQFKFDRFHDAIKQRRDWVIYLTHQGHSPQSIKQMLETIYEYNQNKPKARPNKN